MIVVAALVKYPAPAFFQGSWHVGSRTGEGKPIILPSPHVNSNLSCGVLRIGRKVVEGGSGWTKTRNGRKGGETEEVGSKKIVVVEKR